MASNSLPTLLIICGPSGSGKSTLINRLVEEFPEYFEFSVSHTTRKPRKNEKNGISYHFVTENEMNKAIQEGKFIEHAKFNNNLYGTSQTAIENVHGIGKIALLDIDVQGVAQMKNKTSFQTWKIFVKPPSLEVLAKRLRSRSTESEESITRRLEISKSEIEFVNDSQEFDLVIVNDDFEVTYGEVKEFVLANVLVNLNKV